MELSYIEKINETIKNFIDNNPDKKITRSCPSEKDGYITLWYIEDGQETGQQSGQEQQIELLIED